MTVSFAEVVKNLHVNTLCNSKKFRVAGVVIWRTFSIFQHFFTGQHTGEQ